MTKETSSKVRSEIVGFCQLFRSLLSSVTLKSSTCSSRSILNADCKYFLFWELFHFCWNFPLADSRYSYQVGFFKDREFTVITVDDRIPCGMSGRPIYAHCADRKFFLDRIHCLLVINFICSWWILGSHRRKSLCKDARLLREHYRWYSFGCACRFDWWKRRVSVWLRYCFHIRKYIEFINFSEIENTDKFWRELLQFTKEKYLMGSACNNRRKRIDLGIIDVSYIIYL